MSDEQIKTLRSDFLVHWRGKSIEEKYCNDTKRRKYVESLRTTLEGGLWMNDRDMEFHSPDSGGKLLRFTWQATCFTEIKLSSASDHAKRYGSLGFGFTRRFVMERLGAPVLYVPGDRELERGAVPYISQHFYKLLLALDHFDKYKDIPTLTKFMQNSGLAEKLEKAGYGRDSENPQRIFEYLRASVITCAIFVKEMSDEKCTHAFELLDEAEWRIPYTERMETGKEPKTKEIEVAKRPPKYKLVLKPKDLKVLILPDSETRKMMFEDPDIQKWFRLPNGRSPVYPVITTVDECSQF